MEVQPIPSITSKVSNPNQGASSATILKKLMNETLTNEVHR